MQGDVGSGKTIVSLLAISNVIESGYQCALMSPTEILAKQHFELAKKIYKNSSLKINFDITFSGICISSSYSYSSSSSYSYSSYYY